MIDHKLPKAFVQSTASTRTGIRKLSLPLLLSPFLHKLDNRPPSPAAAFFFCFLSASWARCAVRLLMLCFTSSIFTKIWYGDDTDDFVLLYIAFIFCACSFFFAHCKNSCRKSHHKCEKLSQPWMRTQTITVFENKIVVKQYKMGPFYMIFRHLFWWGNIGSATFSWNGWNFKLWQMWKCEMGFQRET